MNTLTADISYNAYSGVWSVSFSRGGVGWEDQFSPDEIRAVANLWTYLGRILEDVEPKTKWKRSLELFVDGHWYVGMERVV